jgi:hypothetical protein
MTLSPTAVADLRSEWAGVVNMRKRMRLLVVATFAGGAITGPALAGVVYNVPLLLAFDVLRQTLAWARDEKLFACSRRQLGDLMDCSKDYLPWTAWGALREGVRRRNAIAHDGQLFEAKQCLQDIANVEAQLLTWGIIEAAGGTAGNG